MVTKRRRRRLSASIQADQIKQFVAGPTARSTADLVGVNRHTAPLYFHKLRELIAVKLAEQTPWLSGEIEVDESYFGGTRKGTRERGAAGKVPVFGLLKRGGKVHAAIIPHAKQNTLLPIIRQTINPIASSIQTASPARMPWMFPNSTMCGSITPRFSSKTATISMVLRISGNRQSVIYAASMASRSSTSICSSRNANGASTIVQPKTCSMYRWHGLNRIYFNLI